MSSTKFDELFLFIFSIDGSKQDGSLGRLVTDNHKSPNCTMKKVIVNRPHFCLFAVRNIEIGPELEHNYGDSKWPCCKKLSLLDHALVTRHEVVVSLYTTFCLFSENFWVLVGPVSKLYLKKKIIVTWEVPETGWWTRNTSGMHTIPIGWLYHTFFIIEETVYTRPKPGFKEWCVGAKEMLYRHENSPNFYGHFCFIFM